MGYAWHMLDDLDKLNLAWWSGFKHNPVAPQKCYSLQKLPELNENNQITVFLKVESKYFQKRRGGGEVKTFLYDNACSCLKDSEEDFYFISFLITFDVIADKGEWGRSWRSLDFFLQTEFSFKTVFICAIFPRGSYQAEFEKKSK